MSFRRVVEVWDAAQHLTAMQRLYGDLERLLDATLLHPLPIHKRIPNDEYLTLWNQQAELLPWIEPVVKNEWGQNVGIVHGGGWLNVPLLLERWRDHLKASGRFQSRSLSPDDRRDLASGHWDALVDCRGFHQRTATGVSPLDIRGNRGEILTIRTPTKPPAQDRIHNFGKWVIPIGNGHWRLGASYEWNRMDLEPTEDTARHLLQAFQTANGHEISGEPPVAHDVGIRPVSKDRRPAVGLHPESNNWFVFNGLGTRGVLIGPRWSQLLADHILSQSLLPEALNPARLLND